MKKEIDLTNKMNLFSLSWPLYIEFTLRILMGNIDTYMISSYSEKAVAGIAIASQVLTIVIVLGSFLTNGMVILVSQYLGAKKEHKVNSIVNNSLFFNTLIGIFSGILILFFSKGILELFATTNSMLKYAEVYLNIIGGFFVLELLSIVISSILRCYGFTKENMYTMSFVNIINVLGNFLVLNNFLGNHLTGVLGFGIVSIVCKFVGLTILIIIMLKKTSLQLSFYEMIKVNSFNAYKIFFIGIATGTSQLSFQASQLIITYFISSFGEESLNARIYSQNIFNLITLIPGAISKANQVIIGYKLGKGEYEDAYKINIRNSIVGSVISTMGLILVLFFSKQLIGIFTSNSLTIQIGVYFMIFLFLSEPGRAFNLVTGSSLYAAGDINFSVTVNIVGMWVIGVGFSYILGVYGELGLIGIGIATFIDETLRGGLLFYRWRTKKWLKKININ